MRKVISIIFFMFLFALGASAETTQVNFDHNIETGKYTVSGRLEEARGNGYVSIQVIDINNLDEGAKVFGGERVSHLSYIEVSDFEGNFTYTFEFGDLALSGEYMLRIGAKNLLQPIEKKVSYLNKTETDIIVFKIQQVSLGNGTDADKLAAVDEILSIIDGKLAFLGVEDSEYSSLSLTQKKNIAESILNNKADFNTISKATKIAYGIQILSNATGEKISKTLETEKNTLEIEKEIMYSEYENIADKTQFNNIFDTYTLSDVDSVKTAFNESVLVCLMDNSLPGKITEMFKQYKKVFPFELSDYEKSNKSQMAYTLAGKRITSMKVLEQLIKDIYKEQNSDKKDTSSSGGSSGGGGGGGGGAFIAPSATKPVTENKTEASASSDTSVFADLKTVEWAREAIEELAKRDIVSGVGDKYFAPERNVTREEFVKIILNAFDVDVKEYEACEFSDVEKSSWAYPYIAKAKEMGIVSGINSTLFGMGKNITREDMAVILVRAMNVCGMEIKSIEDNVAFSDAEAVSDYAVESVEMLVEAGIINGFDDNTFRPQSNATRAQSAYILYSVIK